MVIRLALWVPRVRPLRTSTSDRGSHSLHIHHTPGPRLHQHPTLPSSPFPGGQTEAPSLTVSGEQGICAVGHQRRECTVAPQSPALIKHHCPLLVCDLWPFTQPGCASVSCPVKTGITPSPGSKPVGSRKLRVGSWHRGLHTIDLLFPPKVEKITKIEGTMSAGRELRVRGGEGKQRYHSARTRIRRGRAQMPLKLPPLNPGRATV